MFGERLYKIIKNLNPPTFTNMMFPIPAFGLINRMWLFVLLYETLYPMAAMGRFALLYRKMPAADPL